VNNFLFMGGTYTQFELRQIMDGYFFSSVDNLTGTRYFTTAIIQTSEYVFILLLFFARVDFVILTMTCSDC
jgi:hypothetical protein